MIRKLFLPTRQESHGRYCLRFFKENNWVPVYIDDTIPCNAMGTPLFSSLRWCGSSSGGGGGSRSLRNSRSSSRIRRRRY